MGTLERATTEVNAVEICQLADTDKALTVNIIYIAAGLFRSKSSFLTRCIDPGMFINQGRNILARPLENGTD
jgi:hypothetical protein